jgi:hypothetical protein
VHVYPDMPTLQPEDGEINEYDGDGVLTCLMLPVRVFGDKGCARVSAQCGLAVDAYVVLTGYVANDAHNEVVKRFQQIEASSRRARSPTRPLLRVPASLGRSFPTLPSACRRGRRGSGEPHPNSTEWYRSTRSKVELQAKEALDKAGVTSDEASEAATAALLGAHCDVQCVAGRHRAQRLAAARACAPPAAGAARARAAARGAARVGCGARAGDAARQWAAALPTVPGADG